jgi:cation:H+ antiporter
MKIASNFVTDRFAETGQINKQILLMINILGFLLCAAVIFFAGQKLSYYGDQIAEKTGLGKAWIGLILMASVTSLPELMVGVSSAAIVQSPDLAVGDVVGSCCFNLAILAMLDIFIPKKQHLFFVASPRHILSGALGIVLMAMVALGLFLPSEFTVLPGIGIMSISFLLIYLFSIRVLYKFETGNQAASAEENHSREGLRKIILYYILFALVVIAAALAIPYFADRIAEQTGLGKSFIGTVLVAASTSLPEIAVSLAAIRLGSVDMAIGNLFGSNIFNVLILVVDDAVYTKGVLLKDASDVHLLPVMAVIIMTALAIAGFTYRAPAKRFLMALDAFLILAVYLLAMVVLFYLSQNI